MTSTADAMSEKYGVPDFIKLDVEGHECEVLHGATSILKTGITSWLIEITQDEKEIFEILSDNGLVICDMNGKQISRPECYVEAIHLKLYKERIINSRDMPCVS